MKSAITCVNADTWQSAEATSSYSLMRGIIPRLAVTRFSKGTYHADVQQIDTSNMVYYYCSMKYRDGLAASFFIDEGLVATVMLLKGNINLHSPDSAAFKLSSGQAGVLYGGSTKMILETEPCSELVLFLVLTSNAYVVGQTKLEMGLTGFEQQVKEGNAVWLCERPLFMHMGIYALIKRIIDVPYDKDLSALYDQCGYLLVQQTVRLAAGALKQEADPAALAKAIQAIQLFIDMHIAKHYTISALARKAGINERQLKTGFKAMYGKGVYGYLKQQRMTQAYRLLSNTKEPLKYIARQCSYKSTGGFIKAFKKHFGKTPGMVRRK